MSAKTLATVAAAFAFAAALYEVTPHKVDVTIVSTGVHEEGRIGEPRLGETPRRISSAPGVRLEPDGRRPGRHSFRKNPAGWYWSSTE
jgi:hypothetical protein